MVTINPDGSPQVTVVWSALDGDDVVSAHMGKHGRAQRSFQPAPVAAYSSTRARISAFSSPVGRSRS